MGGNKCMSSLDLNVQGQRLLEILLPVPGVDYPVHLVRSLLSMKTRTLHNGICQDCHPRYPFFFSTLEKKNLVFGIAFKRFSIYY